MTSALGGLFRGGASAGLDERILTARFQARLEVGLRTSLGPIASLRLFVEQGSNDYTAFSGAIDRQEDYRATGGELRIALGRFSLILGATRTRYDSDLPGYDRDITVIRSGLVLGRGGDSPWG